MNNTQHLMRLGRELTYASAFTVALWTVTHCTFWLAYVVGGVL